MIGKQMRLPGIDPPRQIRPSAGRPNPAFWVRRLRVLSELASGNEYIVRDIELRRGLNIVWAPPHAPGSGNALFQDGVAGHTAGKTTFCRLLRYVLGERGFAPDAVKRRIRSKLPGAWVAADVVVNEVTWVVARPLGIGPHSFCLRDRDFSKLADGGNRVDYQEFLNALAEATTRSLPHFPASEENVQWAHLLPWLARDQECRFSDFLEWRHGSSDSEAPALNVDERQFLVRSVLGLISDAESIEQRTNARLVAAKKDAARLEPLARHLAENERKRLTEAIGQTLDISSTALFSSEAQTELARRRDDLEMRTKALEASDQRERLRTALEDSSRKEGTLKKLLDETKWRLALEQQTLGQLTGQEQSAVLASLPPSRDFCSVPLRVAYENGCPIAQGRPTDLGTQRSKRTAEEELKVHRGLVASLQVEVGRLEAEMKSCEATTAEARRAFMSASTAFEDQRFTLRSERSSLDRLGELAEAAEIAARDAATKAEATAAIERDIVESYARQEKAREEQQAALNRFSGTFDYIVRAIIGDAVSARVDTSGRSLALIVDEHGERESAAITTVKLLAFDLAAVVASIEGEGSFPRFLIHDGPREADLAPDVYERLFFFAHELEKCFEEAPSFQYIVTTTTKPPDMFVNSDSQWLRLRLAGIPAEERLLRLDL